MAGCSISQVHWTADRLDTKGSSLPWTSFSPPFGIQLNSSVSQQNQKHSESSLLFKYCLSPASFLLFSVLYHSKLNISQFLGPALQTIHRLIEKINRFISSCLSDKHLSRVSKLHFLLFTIHYMEGSEIWIQQESRAPMRQSGSLGLFSLNFDVPFIYLFIYFLNTDPLEEPSEARQCLTSTKVNKKRLHTFLILDLNIQSRQHAYAKKQKLGNSLVARWPSCAARSAA